MNDLSHPTLDFGQNLAPIYIQLSTVFRRFVATGEWPVGGRIPTHERLAAQFGVNPATIRKAIEILAREGLVVTHRRRGTVVLAKGAPETRYDIPSDWAGLVAGSDMLTCKPIESLPAKSPPQPFHQHGTTAGSYQVLRRLYLCGGQSLGVETAYIERGLHRAIGLRRLTREPFWRLIEEAAGAGIARADQTIVFGIADGGIAAELGIPLNGPVATVHRSVYDGRSRLICEVTSCYRGDRVRIHERLTGLGEESRLAGTE